MLNKRYLFDTFGHEVALVNAISVIVQKVLDGLYGKLFFILFSLFIRFHHFIPSTVVNEGKSVTTRGRDKL